MRSAILFLLISSALAQTPTKPAAKDPLARVAEEAEVFHQNISRLVGREVLRQRAMKAPPRLRLVNDPRTPSWQFRELVSEYGVTTFKEGGGLMHEVRKVVQVDGRTIAKPEQARISLVRGMTSEDDRIQRKLLLDLEKHGLLGTATDFALSLLLFRRDAIADLVIEPGPREFVKGVELQAYRFRQKSGEAKFSVFEGRELHKQPLVGTLWVQVSDGLPRRLMLISEISRKTGKGEAEVTRDQGTIDYERSVGFGVMLPTQVRHDRTVNGQLVAENRYSYERFQRFTAETEILFTSDDGAGSGAK